MQPDRLVPQLMPDHLAAWRNSARKRNRVKFMATAQDSQSDHFIALNWTLSTAVFSQFLLCCNLSRKPCLLLLNISIIDATGFQCCQSSTAADRGRVRPDCVVRPAHWSASHLAFKSAHRASPALARVLSSINSWVCKSKYETFGSVLSHLTDPLDFELFTARHMYFLGQKVLVTPKIAH